MNEENLKKAGITIRERRRKPDSKGNMGVEYQVINGRKIVSRHVMFNDARKAAEDCLTAES